MEDKHMFAEGAFGGASQDKIDNDGRLCFGKYSGKLVSTVARDDPGYLQWVLDEVKDLNDDDYRVIKDLVRSYVSFYVNMICGVTSSNSQKYGIDIGGYLVFHVFLE